MKSICAGTRAVTNTVEDLNNLLEFCKVAYKMLNKQIASIPHKVKANGSQIATLDPWTI